VLIVDDEPVVRETIAAILETQGFTVLAAPDAECAIEAAKNAGGIDVVVLDLTMPGSSADETHSALRKLLPHAGVLLTSGYSEPGIVDRLCEDRRTRFIQKPFSAESLAQQVVALLR
jgi:CheY-like chemotaxis protein